AGKRHCGATSVWTHVSSLICFQFFLPKSKPIPTGTNDYSCPVICTTRQKGMNSCFKHSQNTSCGNFAVERLGSLEVEMLHQSRPGEISIEPMSALGQKQTYALQKAMSALPPIATAKADIGKTSCLLYPRKRTCAAQLGMSALGQYRTS